MSICITGWKTTIADELRLLIGDKDEVMPWRVTVSSANAMANTKGLPRADRYLFAQGLMFGVNMDLTEPSQVYNVNAISVMQRVHQAFTLNPKARIVVIGSMSAIAGSHDLHYACAKAALHAFVEFYPTPPDGNLVCVAPTIISDSGMTKRRADYPEVLKRRNTVTAKRVAEVCYGVLYGDDPYISGIIQMEGDKIS